MGRGLVLLIAAGGALAGAGLAACSSGGDAPTTRAIVVNSAADGAPSTRACTLRDAILTANAGGRPAKGSGCRAASGTPTIVFRIPGDGVVTIRPRSALPVVRRTTVIDGYSQPGARMNRAISPRPLDGRLRVEIDFAESGGSGLHVAADRSVVRGLVINGADGAGVLVGADDVRIQGNYIGTDPSGHLARPNTGNGINRGFGPGRTDPDRAIIGGVRPSDRNLISGNGGSGITPNTGNDGWRIRGNYVGVAADGVSSLGNSGPAGPGGMSIDNCTGTVVGGVETGAANVVSANKSSGIAVDNSPHTSVTGNLVGVDWTGTRELGNASVGITISEGSDDSVVGGARRHAGNTIAGNPAANVMVRADRTRVEGNQLGTPGGTPSYAGVAVVTTARDVTVGGTSKGSGNSIAVGSAAGVLVQPLEANVAPRVSILGNRIVGPGTAPAIDRSDPRVVPPTVLAAACSGETVTVDVAAPGDSSAATMRIELFLADPSAAPRADTFLGSVDVERGTIGHVELRATHPAGRVVTATATEVLAGEEPDGLGSTSALSAPVPMVTGSPSCAE